MTVLLEYIGAWLEADAEAIARAVAEDCVITECDGPVYRGRAQVREWAQSWFEAGGVVHEWNITDHIVTGDREVAQWIFECTWEGNRASFDGVTVARIEDSLITELREYATTAPLYDWPRAAHKRTLDVKPDSA